MGQSDAEEETAEDNPVNITSLFNGFLRILSPESKDLTPTRRIAVIEDILDTASTLAQSNEQGKRDVACFVNPCLEIVTNEQDHIKLRHGASRFLTNEIEWFIQKNGEMSSVKFVKNFDVLLIGAGDFELQLLMTELICRIIPSKRRGSHAQCWFNDFPSVRVHFLSIRDNEFERDSRKFLNNLNEGLLKNRSVYSVLCKNVYVGLQEIDCPLDEESGMFWTDYNMGSKTITFFATDSEDDSWETVAIKDEFVLQTRILEKKEKKEIVIVIHLNRPVKCLTLLSFMDKGTEKYIKFIYNEDNNPLNALGLLFPQDLARDNSPESPDVITSTPRASVTSSAVHVPSRSKGLSRTVCLSTLKTTPPISDEEITLVNSSEPEKDDDGDIVIGSNDVKTEPTEPTTQDDDPLVAKRKSDRETSVVAKPKSTKKKKTTTAKVRTRAAARLEPVVSTSESEATSRRLRAASEFILKKRNKLGTGYNTEDWMMDYSDAERTREKKEAFLRNANCSKSRIHLLNLVYRENYKSNYPPDYRRWQKLGGPFSFDSRPPLKRNKQGKIMLRPDRLTYRMKKKKQLAKKSGRDLTKSVSLKREDKKYNGQTFSDIAIEARKRHEVAEIHEEELPDDDNLSEPVQPSSHENDTKITVENDSKITVENEPHLSEEIEENEDVVIEKNDDEDFSPSSIHSHRSDDINVNVGSKPSISRATDSGFIDVSGDLSSMKSTFNTGEKIEAIKLQEEGGHSSSQEEEKNADQHSSVHRDDSKMKDSFKTPSDKQTMLPQPKRLFPSDETPVTCIKRRKLLRDDHEDDQSQPRRLFPSSDEDDDDDVRLAALVNKLNLYVKELKQIKIRRKEIENEMYDLLSSIDVQITNERQNEEKCWLEMATTLKALKARFQRPTKQLQQHEMDPHDTLS